MEQPNRITVLPNEENFREFLGVRLATVGVTIGDIELLLEPTYNKVSATFALIDRRYYRAEDGTPLLRTAHYSQSAVFLYHLSRQAYLSGDGHLADRIYMLNVSQSACDLFYEVELPQRVYCDHPLGSVIGRGHFTERSQLVFSDGCTIGNNWGVYPKIDGRLVLLSRSAVIGKTEISGTVVMARGAELIDAGSVENCWVFGSGRDVIFKPIDLQRANVLIPFV